MSLQNIEQFARPAKKKPSLALKLLAVLFFIGLCGWTTATLLISRATSPFELSGSPTPPGHLTQTVENVLGSGDFVTAAPDGEAYVQIRYRFPQVLTSVVLSYAGRPVDPPYRVKTAALSTSDDGVSWTQIAELSESSGKIAFDPRQVGAHQYWKIVVVKSGDATEVVFGRILLIPETGVIQRFPLDVTWLALIPASLLVLLAFQIPLVQSRLFAATAIPTSLFLLLYSFAYIPFHTLFSPDSLSYLQPVLSGTYSAIRNVGYPSVLLSVHNTVGLNNLPWIQAITGVACYLAGAGLLAVRFESKWPALGFASAVLVQGSITHYAPFIMTESFFMAAIAIYAAGLGALARRPSTAGVVAASFGISLAIIIKSIGAVLLLPALLLIRFLPKGKRLSVSGTIVAAGLAAFALIAIPSFIRSGSLTERFSGYSLIGHVSSMLDDRAMPPSDMTRSMIAAVAPVVDQRPVGWDKINSGDSLANYVFVTVNDYNTLLYQKLIPLAGSLGSTDAVDAFFLRFAFSSIQAHPFLYMRHVAAHYYGMWLYLGYSVNLRYASIMIRESVTAVSKDPLRALIPATVISPYPDKDVVASEAADQAGLPLLVEPLFDVAPPGPRLTRLIGLLTLFLSILFLIPGRLANMYRAEIMMALTVNAYFGAHVLLQVALPRYATAAILAVILLSVCFVCTTLSALRIDDAVSLLKRVRPARA